MRPSWLWLLQILQADISTKNEEVYELFIFCHIMFLRSAGLVTIHPITRIARLHNIYPSKTLALQTAILLAKQDIELSALRGIVIPRLYVGDSDEIEYELRRIRKHIVAYADMDKTNEYMPHLYSVIISPYLNELAP